MRFLYSQSIQQIKKPDGKKITAFKVLKGKDGMISQVKGITSKENNSMYDVHMDVKKVDKLGHIEKKHKTFKIKSSDILSLLKESHSKDLKESSNKKINDIKKNKVTINKKIKKNKVTINKKIKKDKVMIDKKVKKDNVMVDKKVKKDNVMVDKKVKKGNDVIDKKVKKGNDIIDKKVKKDKKIVKK